MSHTVSTSGTSPGATARSTTPNGPARAPVRHTANRENSREGGRFCSIGPEGAWVRSEYATELFVTTAPTSVALSSELHGVTLQQAVLLWTAGSVAFGLALLLSVALPVREESVVALLPVDPVRLMGGLLGAGTLCVAGATALPYTQRDVVGFPVPVGVVVIGLLALMLFRTEQRGHDESGAEADRQTTEAGSGES